MRILSVTAGAAEMYCGSCLRDNSLARELKRRGHDVILVPIYTPTKVEGVNVSGGPVLFGGISVYLQQHSALFRHTPRWMDRLWDSQWALKKAAARSIPVNPKFLGEMTVSMLKGEKGPLAKEFDKLEYWFSHEQKPDVVSLPNALVISLARSIRHQFAGPLCVTLQGEDLFLESLMEPYRSEAMKLIREQLKYVDGFISISEAYADFMAGYLGIPRQKIHVVRLGVRADDFLPATPAQGPFTVGYLARIAPEKGLHLLIEAWKLFRKLSPEPVQLLVAGYLAPENREYLAELQRQVEFIYAGELSRDDKVKYLAGLHAFSVPVVYDDPKGLYSLEAMAAGVPVVLPRRGALTEHVTRAGGGLLFTPDSPSALAAALDELRRNPARARELGNTGREGVKAHYSVERMADETLSVYQGLGRPAAAMVV